MTTHLLVAGVRISPKMDSGDPLPVETARKTRKPLVRERPAKKFDVRYSSRYGRSEKRVLPLIEYVRPAGRGGKGPASVYAKGLGESHQGDKWLTSHNKQSDRLLRNNPSPRKISSLFNKVLVVKHYPYFV